MVINMRATFSGVFLGIDTVFGKFLPKTHNFSTLFLITILYMSVKIYYIGRVVFGVCSSTAPMRDVGPPDPVAETICPSVDGF